MSDHGAVPRARLSKAQVFGDRVHRHSAPIEVIFRALTDQRARWWLELQPGEVEPEVLEAVPFELVVWSSFWPISPDDTIRFDLSEVAGERCMRSPAGLVDDQPTAIRLRWFTAYPPDERGVAITRQRLNRKIGGDLRAVTSAYYWGTLPPDGGMPPPPRLPRARPSPRPGFVTLAVGDDPDEDVYLDFRLVERLPAGAALRLGGEDWLAGDVLKADLETLVGLADNTDERAAVARAVMLAEYAITTGASVAIVAADLL